MIRWFFLIGLLWGCGLVQTQPRASVREAVIRSWRGVDLIVLERHPLFSHRTPEIRQLSDGTESWVYSACRIRSRSGAYATGHVAMGNSQTWNECCYSQFFVAPTPGGGRQVTEYRPVGACATDCTVGARGCRY